MALVVKDRVQEVTTTAGTGTITLGGAVLGFQSFATIGNGNTTYYTINDPITGDWEVGIGTYTSAGPSLSRDTVLSSSSGGTLVSFAAGSKNVFVTYPSERSVYLDSPGSYPVQNTFNALSATTATLTAGTVSTTPSSGTDLANKSYVDTVAAAGIHYHAPVYVESPNTAGNLNAAYNQPGGPGVGVGATLTNAGTKAALTIDGVLMTTTKRVLIYNQTNAYENGVYTVTTVGTPDPGGTNWVLTRATDADTYAPSSPNSLGQGDAFFVTNGDTGAGEGYVCTTVGVITFGTTAITFSQFSAAQVYNAGTGLNLSPSTTFNISNTGVTAATYGSASQVPVFAVNAQGQITSVTNTSIAIAAGAVSGLAASATTDTTNATNITSGTLPTGRLSGSYTGITGVGTLTAGTWNGSVIGPVYGGTGFGTYAVGDLLYADTTTSLAKLADVAVGNALISGGVGSAPSWGKIGLATHVSGTLPVASGGTGVTSSTGTGSVVLSTSPSLVTPILGTPQSGNFSTGTFTWPTFNQNTTGSAGSAANLTGGTISGNYTISNAASPNTYYLQFGDNTGWTYRFMTSVAGTPTTRFSFTDQGAFNAVGAITQNGSQVLTAGNYNSYAPTLTGGGASGTWSISITGSAGSTSSVAGTTATAIQSAYQAAINTTTPGTGTYGIHFNGQTTADYAAGVTWNGGTTTTQAHAGIYVQGSGAYGTKMYLATTDSYAAGSKTALSIDHSGTILTTRSYLQATGSLRAPIFYDSDNTGYYGDFASTSNVNQINMAGYLRRNSSAAGYMEGNYPTSTDGNSSAAIYTIGGAYQPASTTLGNMYGVGYTVGTGTASPGLGQTGWGFYVASGGTSRIFLDSDNGVGIVTGSFRAPIFYDSNDTTYFIDPNSISSLFGVAIRGDLSSTGTSNQLFLWGTGNSTTSAIGFKASGGYFPNPTGAGDGYNTYLTMDTDGRGWVFRRGVGGTDFGAANTSGWILNNGLWQANASMRAPIFYDSDNTGYYLDPASTSDSALRIRGGALHGPNTTWSQYLYVGTNGNIDVNTATVAVTNGNLHIDARNGYVLYLNNYATSSYTVLNQSARSPIFYDLDNTGYYGDFASTSNFNRLNLVGWDSSGRNYSREWIELPNYTGIYSPNNGAHFYPNNLSSYTPWVVQGSRSGWHGLHFYAGGNTPHLMFDGSANGGIYYEAGGRWGSYYNYSNNCWGFGTSSTSSAYNIYCLTGVYSGGRVDGTIFYDSNNTGYYVDPASVSNLNGLQIGGSSFTVAGGTVSVTSGSPSYFMARAWVNFSGTGGTSIRSSVGVSSVSYVGTGDYVVNFSVAMPDANYATTASIGRNGTGVGGYLGIVSDRIAQTTSAVQVYTFVFSGAATDTPYIAVHVFR